MQFFQDQIWLRTRVDLQSEWHHLKGIWGEVNETNFWCNRRTIRLASQPNAALTTRNGKVDHARVPVRNLEIAALGVIMKEKEQRFMVRHFVIDKVRLQHSWESISDIKTILWHSLCQILGTMDGAVITNNEYHFIPFREDILLWWELLIARQLFVISYTK